MSLPTTDTSEPIVSRSSRRNRRKVIVGALALVLVAGLVFVGAKTNAARPGALTAAGITCQDSAPVDRQTVSWNDNADTTGGTFTMNYRVGRDIGVTTVSGVMANVQI